MFDKLLSYIPEEPKEGTMYRILWCVVVLSFLIGLKNLPLPLKMDQYEYGTLAENVLNEAKYYVYGAPSTYTPVVPVLIILTHIKGYPALGYALGRLVGWLLALSSIWFINKILLKIRIETAVRYTILILMVTNNHYIEWCSLLMPEPIVMILVWPFLWFSIKEIEKPGEINWFAYTLLFSMLVLTKYVYAVFGVIYLWAMLKRLQSFVSDKKSEAFLEVLVFSLLGFIPVLVWGQYVLHIGNALATDHSSFRRFETHSLAERISMGLGLWAPEGARLNGIPALITLIVPVTGLREWISSILFLLSIIFGAYSARKFWINNVLFLALFLLMGGLIFAATGFSRYWMPLFPIMLLGVWYTLDHWKVRPRFFVWSGITLSVLYIINMLRITF